jgi:hypothetical protein
MNEHQLKMPRRVAERHAHPPRIDSHDLLSRTERL